MCHSRCKASGHVIPRMSVKGMGISRRQSAVAVEQPRGSMRHRCLLFKGCVRRRVRFWNNVSGICLSDSLSDDLSDG